MEAKRIVGRPKYEESVVTQIIFLKEKGYTYKEITNELAVSRDTIRRKLREAGKYYGSGNYDRSNYLRRRDSNE